MTNVSLELYRTFWAIGTAGSLTKAAAMLFVTQPSVSSALKSLETQLGTALCVRSQKGVILTAEGQVLFDELNAAMDHIDVAERKLGSLLKLESGRISLSAGDTVCNYFLMPLISVFKDNNPSVKFEITNRTSPETLEIIRARKAEIGFVNILPRPDENIFHVTDCLSLTNILIGGSKYAYLAEKTFQLRELSDYPLIMLERKSSGRIQLDAYLESLGIEANPIFELGSVDLMMNFVSNNYGLAFIHDEINGCRIDGKTLFRIGTTPETPLQKLSMIELKSVPISHASRQFKKYVLTRCGGDPQIGNCISTVDPIQ